MQIHVLRFVLPAMGDREKLESVRGANKSLDNHNIVKIIHSFSTGAELGSPYVHELAIVCNVSIHAGETFILQLLSIRFHHTAVEDRLFEKRHLRQRRIDEEIRCAARCPYPWDIGLVKRKRLLFYLHLS